MKLYWCFSIIFLVKYVYTYNVISENSTELVAVAVISRHGDRSPMRSFPNDQYFNESYWPNGLKGDLTMQGIQRMYNLGQWLRHRYNKFLSRTYSPKELYAYSPNYDRCRMSVMASLAGLYSTTLNNKITQSIPVESQNVQSDEILTQSRYCPKYDKLFNKFEEMKDELFGKKYIKFFEFIRSTTGWKKVSLKQVSALRNILYCYANYNTSFLPEWIHEEDQKLLDYLTGVRHTIPTSTRDLTRLRVGPFYEYIFNFFNKFVTSSSKNQPYKFLMMSTRDLQLSSILDGMDCYKLRPVGFGDTLIWELKKKDEKYFLNLLYKQEDKLEQLDCCRNCDFQMFQRNLTDVIVDIDNWKNECFLF